jgi:hypothetical protein
MAAVLGMFISVGVAFMGVFRAGKGELTGISSNSVFGVQLVGYIGVIFTGTTLTDGRLHQT